MGYPACRGTNNFLINGVDVILNLIFLFQNITSMLKNFQVAQDVTMLWNENKWKNINTIFQENVFENDGCRAMCMFVLPTMCEMGLLL